MLADVLALMKHRSGFAKAETYMDAHGHAAAAHLIHV